MPVLCKVHRGDFIESMHVGFVVVVDSKGEIIPETEFADIWPERKRYLDNALKEEDEDEPDLSDLIKVPVGDDPLQRRWISGNEKPNPLHNNCSGKHAGMLSLAKYLKEDPKGYTDENHAVQKQILEQVKRFSELEEFPIAIDGCSAPVPFLPLYNLALMYQKLASTDYDELNILYDAVISNPYQIAGKDRFDTDFIQAMNGNAITKVGGEGVRGVGVRTSQGDVYGIALKIIDGNQRCNPAAILAVLNELKLINEDELEALNIYHNIKLKNHRGIEIGSIQIEL